MKKNVTILIGLVVLVAVPYAGVSFIREGKGAFGGSKNDESALGVKAFVGQVVRVYEGQNLLEYGFDIPETASTTVDMDGALIRVTDASNTPIVTFYMSYEGGRGYTALDYLSEVVAPHVNVIDPTGTSTIGMYEWQLAETANSEWHIASVDNGKWLIVAESKKSVHDEAEKILESVNAK